MLVWWQLEPAPRRGSGSVTVDLPVSTASSMQ
jgi:hypothetical protein